MIQDPGKTLSAGLHALDLRVAPTQRAKLLELARLVLAENERTNLTGARDIASLVRAHLLDSLAPLRFARLRSPIIDVGSGAGFPGLPAAIAYPSQHFILLEPRAKRFQFLKDAVWTLGLSNVSLVKSSALGPGAADLKESAALVIMRAVADPGRSMRLGLPLIGATGQMLLYEGKRANPSPQEREIAARFGCRIVVESVRVPDLAAARHAWLITKQRSRFGGAKR